MTPDDLMLDDASPVFLVGATRSGTTLLRLMMDHHPELSNFGEFEYAVKWLEGDRPPLLDAYHRLLEMDRVFRDHGWQIDPKLAYIPLVRSFLRQAFAASRKQVPGATVHSRFDCLPIIWPQARFIHLVRDPRDVARSSIPMGWVGNVWYGAEYWLQPVARWQQLRDTLPRDRWLQVRFEDLIQDPSGELTRICHFLGVEYSPAMLEYANDSTYDLPDPGLVNQWQQKLSAHEIQWVESVCHGAMHQFGYEPVSPSLAPPGPLTSLRLATQHRLSRIQRNIQRYGLPLYARWQIAKRLPYCEIKKRVLRQIDEVDTARLK
jgi:hypothetical protein